MKPYVYRFSLVIVFIFAFLTACSQATPTAQPFPTPDVPPIEDIDQAVSRWENGNNLRYVVSVEETTHVGTTRYHVVVADGGVRAAQQQVEVEGVWQAPTTLDVETAQKYTVDALLERIRNDALGMGAAPIDMKVIFDSFSGFPTVVTAKALPTYNAEGNLLLNRDLGYTFTSEVKVLIEDTTGLSKDPVLYMTRSGGEQALCDTLRVYPDGTSVYTDDCRQTLLQLTPPANQVTRLLELAATLHEVDQTREDGATSHLVLYGTGTETPDASTLEGLWDVGRELADLLSHPIGAGITLLYTQHDQLFGYDMRSSLGQPATLDLTQPLHGMVSNPDGSSLAYADDKGFHWLDLLTGGVGLFFANPPEGYYLPRAWNSQALLLQRIQGTSAPEWGWTTREDPSWHAIPLPVGALTCDTGLSLSPNTPEFVVAAGGDCLTDMGLTLVNMMDGSTRKFLDAQSVPGSGAFDPAWSPDGNWIVFSLNLMDTPDNPQRIYLVRADGTELTSLTDNTTGQASHPIWANDSSRIYYALNGTEIGEDGIYVHHLSGQMELVLPGSGLHPVSISPADEFLVFSTGTEMNAYLFSLKTLYPVTRGIENEEVFFIGWLDERTDK